MAGQLVLIAMAAGAVAMDTATTCHATKHPDHGEAHGPEDTAPGPHPGGTGSLHCKVLTNSKQR